MTDKEQNKQPANNAANHFWEKPIGKILISVIAGTIVIFIGIGINRSCSLKPTANEKTGEPKASKDNQTINTTHDTPEKIISEIQSAPPLQREDIAKTYAGVPVSWELYFASGQPEKEEYRLFFLTAPDSIKAFITCSVPKTNNEHLRRLAEKTKLRVQGKIDKITDRTIWLKDTVITQ